MKNYNITICSLFLFLFLGCSDVLDKYPLDRPSLDTFYSNATEISGGIVACYNMLQEHEVTTYQFPIVLDAMADCGFVRQDEEYKFIGKGEHDAKSVVIKAIWTRCYVGIARCNNMLEVIEKRKELLTNDQINQYKGEILFMRAYYHARLALYWGDVPLILSPVTIGEASSIPRTPREEVIVQVMKDFTDAANLLPLQYIKVAEIGRATKGTANAYKARYALYFGKYDIAAEAAKAVMDSKIYELYPSYANLFLTAGLWDANNKEIIFKREWGGAQANDWHGIPQFLFTRSTNGYAAMVPSQNLIDSYYCIDGKNIAESPLFDKDHPFENRDTRLRLSIVVPGDRFGNFRFDGHIDSVLCYNYVTGEYETNRDSYSFSPYTSYTGYNSRKFADPAYVNRVTQGDYPTLLCRYAEVLLTYAEAKVEMNSIDQSVVDAINLIRTGRADVYMPPYTLSDFSNQQTARLKVRHERKIELAFEGFRYTDLRRWGLAEKYLNRPVMGRPFMGGYDEWPDVTFDENGEPVYDYLNYAPHPSKDYRVVESRLFVKNKHELWPIPNDEINLNPNLVQNPGY